MDKRPLTTCTLLTLPSICITLHSNDPSLTTRLLPRSWNGGPPFFFVPSMLRKHQYTRTILVYVEETTGKTIVKAITIIFTIITRITSRNQHFYIRHVSRYVHINIYIHMILLLFIHILDSGRHGTVRNECIVRIV